MSENLNKCVWMWAGLLTYRLCDRDYQCAGCPVEALFHPAGVEDAARHHAAVPFRSPGMPQAPDRFHDQQHLWLRVLPEGRLQVGLDPMACRLLERASHLQLPRAGSHVRRGEPAFSVGLDAGTVEFTSPVAGDVLRVHEVPERRISRMLRRPYSRSWLMVLAVPRLERQLVRFLFGRGAGLRLAREWGRFQEECLGMAADGPAATPALPDGGEVDLEWLERHDGNAYAELLRRWIGAGRLRSGRRGARRSDPGPSRTDRGPDSPEER